MTFPMVREEKPETFIRDEKQNRVGVRVYRNGSPYTLSGEVSAICLKPDGSSFEFNQNGSVSGNSASIVLADECYEQDGRINIALVLTDNGRRTTLGVCRGTVYPTRI